MKPFLRLTNDPDKKINVRGGNPAVHILIVREHILFYL